MLFRKKSPNTIDEINEMYENAEFYNFRIADKVILISNCREKKLKKWKIYKISFISELAIKDGKYICISDGNIADYVSEKDIELYDRKEIKQIVIEPNSFYSSEEELKNRMSMPRFPTKGLWKRFRIWLIMKRKGK